MLGGIPVFLAQYAQKILLGVLVEKSGPQDITAKHNLQVYDGVCTARFNEGSKMQVIPYTKIIF